MNILFTGANGFLGKNVIPHISKDNKIYSLDLSKADFTCNISNQIPDFKEFEFDIVFHAAGKAHSIPKNLTEEKIFFDINETGTKNLCRALEANELPKTFIFISTVAVYGVEYGELIDENYPLNGQTPYAKSKINSCVHSRNIVYNITKIICIKNTFFRITSSYVKIFTGFYSSNHIS